VDIVSTHHSKNKLPVFIQCKTSIKGVPYWKILKQMPTQLMPVIFMNKTNKVNKNFISDGEFVILKKKDFYKILKEWNLREK